MVLEYCGHLVPETEDDSEAQPASTTREANDAATGNSASLLPHEEAAKSWVERLTSPIDTSALSLDDDEDNDDDKEFKQKVERNKIDNATMEEIASILRGEPSARISTPVQNKKKMLDILDVPRKRRRYQMLLGRKLKELAKARKLTGLSGLNKTLLVDKLVEDDDKRLGRTHSNMCTSRTDLKGMCAFLNSSFLRLQKQKIEQDAAHIGHQNEKPFIEQFHDCCLDAASQS